MHKAMGRLRSLAFAGQGSAGPWVVLNPSFVVTGVYIEDMVINGTFGDEVFIVFFRAPIRSTFLQRLALARHLFFERADTRMVWSRDHQVKTGVERIPIAVEVNVAVGQDQALFVAVVDAVAPLTLELFGNYFK